MSAETLRRAAALMRERAEAAHQPTGAPPRWHVTTNRHPNTDGTPWGCVEYRLHPAGGAGPRVMTWSGRDGKADATHIASWHPAVALAVADWLDTAGADLWAHGPMCVCEDGCDACDDELWLPHVRRALAVARAYLGETR